MSRLLARVVATTRDGAPDDPLVEALEREGATVRVWPTIDFDPPADPGPLRRACARLDAYDWVVFTSVRSVEPVIVEAGVPARPLRVAAVGEPTAAALRSAGWPVEVVGDEGAIELVEAMALAGGLAGGRVLFPASSLAATTLEDRLQARGARVERVEAYRTRLTPPDPGTVREDLRRGVDVVAFASPSAVTSLARALEDEWPRALGPVGYAAIGQTTRRALLGAGVAEERIETASPPTVSGLVDACVRLTATAPLTRRTGSGQPARPCSTPNDEDPR